MMHFDWKGFLRTFWLFLFHWRRTGMPRTWRWTLFLVGFFLVYPLVEIVNAICFRLDWLLFPSLRRMKIERPVFIVGPPRTGTTRLHRMMALDEDQFFCFKTWEMMFPSLLQKRIVAGAGALDRLLGRPLARLLERFQERRFRQYNRIHHLSLFAPEEDDKLCAHIFSSQMFLWILPFHENFDRYIEFDRLLAPADRQRVMSYFHACLLRQACFRGAGRRYLGKSPLSALRLRSLYETFPDCEVLATVRTPLEVYPSTLSLAEAALGPFGLLPGPEDLKSLAAGILRGAYLNPLKVLDAADPRTYRWVLFLDIAHRPAQTTKALYAYFGWPLSAAFEARLAVEDERARGYRSEHDYSLAKYGLSAAEIAAEYGPVFDRFHFSTAPSAPREEDGPGGGSASVLTPAPSAV